MTVEGLSLREKEAFVFAFGSCGSVQCGFCIPGMVLAAKVLIDNNPNPSQDEIRKANTNTSPRPERGMIRRSFQASPITTTQDI
ncbi:MAG: hypothetical protein II787_04075 [Lachnospiraceae bacterium]|nr:hypothetical protein [Lachnospiraceae bacterium]